MKLTITINKKAFPDVDPGLLEDMLGVLPYWVVEFILYGTDRDIVEFMTERYGFGKLYQFKGKVSEDGTYKNVFLDELDPCAEDPDLPYVGKMNTPSGTVYFYPYAMIALPLPNGEYFVTRMD